MKLIDLSHATQRRDSHEQVVPLVVRSVDPIYLVPLDRLVTQATVIDLTNRRDPAEITRVDVMSTGLAGIGGCILRTDWSDNYLQGSQEKAPYMTMDAAIYLAEAGVKTIASDFPISSDAADFLLHNNCVLIQCITNLSALTRRIVRLIALPLKLQDTPSADARVIAIEEQ